MNTTQLLFSLLIAISFFSCEKETEKDSTSTLVEVKTLDATEISLESAKLNGELSQKGLKTFGFVYSKDSLFENSQTVTISNDELDGLNFEKNILNLEPDQNYYYKAFYGTVYGDVKKLKTFNYPLINISSFSITDKNVINIEGHTSSDIKIQKYQMGFKILSKTNSDQQVKIDAPKDNGFKITFDNLHFNSSYLIVPFVEVDDKINYQDTLTVKTLSNFTISYEDSLDLSGLAFTPIVIPQTTNSKISQSYYLQKIDAFSNGNVLNSRRTEIPSNVLFAGGNNSNAKIINMDVFNNSIAWEYTIGGSSQECIYDICIVNDGYLCLGITNSNDEDFAIRSNTSYDFFLLKLNKSGEMMWVKTYGTSKNDYPEKIIPNSSGNFFLVGYSFSHNKELEINSTSSYLLEVNNSGEIIEEEFYPILNGSNIINACATPSGELFIGGTANSETGNGISSSTYKASLSQVSGANVSMNHLYDGEKYDDIRYIFEGKNDMLIILGNTDSKSNDFSDNKIGSSPWLALTNKNGAIIESYILCPNTNATLKDAQIIDNLLYVIFEDKTNNKAYKIQISLN